MTLQGHRNQSGRSGDRRTNVFTELKMDPGNYWSTAGAAASPEGARINIRDLGQCWGRGSRISLGTRLDCAYTSIALFIWSEWPQTFDLSLQTNFTQEIKTFTFPKREFAAKNLVSCSCNRVYISRNYTACVLIPHYSTHENFAFCPPTSFALPMSNCFRRPCIVYTILATNKIIVQVPRPSYDSSRINGGNKDTPTYKLQSVHWLWGQCKLREHVTQVQPRSHASPGF